MNKVIDLFEERNKNFLSSKLPSSKHFAETLRKKNRNKMIQQKRIFHCPEFDESSILRLFEKYPELENGETSISEKYQQILSLFNKEPLENIDLLLESISNFNKSDILPEIYISVDISSKLLSCLKSDNKNQILKALLIIINSTYRYSDCQESLIKQGGREVLIDLVLKYWEDPEILTDGLWSLSHLISESRSECLLIQSSGLFEKILKKLDNDLTIKFYVLEVLLSFVSVFVKYTRPLPQGYFNSVIELIPKFLGRNEPEILSRCFWILSSLAESTANVRKIMIPDVLNRLEYGIHHSLKDLRDPALRLAGLIVFGSTGETFSLVKIGLLDVCFEVLVRDDQACNDVLWILNNIALEGDSFKEMILNHSFFKEIINKTENHYFKTKIQALELLETLLDLKTPQQVTKQIPLILPCLVEAMKCNDSRAIKPAIRTLDLAFVALQVVSSIEDRTEYEKLVRLLNEVLGC
jgi:hypothetical protein